MKKRIVFISTCCLIVLSTLIFLSAEITQARDMSGIVLQDSDYTLDNSHRGYLDKLIREANDEALLEVVYSAPQSYSYFTPTGDDVRVRRGPGIDYRINYSVHLNEPEEADFPGDFPMSVLGGIVGSSMYEGDENCSKWQEVIAVNAGSYRVQGLDIMESIGDAGHYPSYICSDFIQTEPVEPYLDEWLNSKFKIIKISNQYIFGEVVDVNNSVTFPPDYPAFVETIVDSGDRIVFTSLFYDGMMDEEVKIYKLLDDVYVIEVGTLKVDEIEEQLQLDEAGIQSLQNFVQENNRLRDYY